ncbi:Mobile element protein [Paraburkholderia caribensis MBA4]|uniref:Mobile element protein n=1 Tax=Paraburkholderia caribensis MBA4 TaxID=1323664 RepID=A0A0P0RDM8_9BURK|nr:Mobile element protein [Paraburkholderia caribensis MBA4]
MNATGTITMTMRELDRYKVIQDVTDCMLKPWRAAERLGLTTGQARDCSHGYMKAARHHRFGMVSHAPGSA